MPTPTYTPLVDVAFKKRMATNFNSKAMEGIVREAISNIPNSSLSNGMQRMALSNHLLDRLGISPTQYACIIVVDRHGKHVKLTDPNVKQELLGTYNEIEYFGLKLAGSTYGYTGEKRTGVYDAVLRDEEEGRGIDEAVERQAEAPIEQEIATPTKPKKAKKE